MNTPGIYYALSYCMAAGALLYVIPWRFNGRKTMTAWLLFSLLLSGIMYISDGERLLFIPLMLLYVGMMILLFKLTGRFGWSVAAYFGMRCFIIGEFCASLGWLLVFLWQKYVLTRLVAPPILLLCTIFIYILFYGSTYAIEKKYTDINANLHFSLREIFSVALITVSIFTVSNLSYIVGDSMAIGSVREIIFYVRTVVDMAGCAVLYAYHVQRGELGARLELQKLTGILDMQYHNYEMLDSAMEMVNQKYHDLKYQINLLKAGRGQEDLSGILQIEEDIKSYEAQNKTGHKIVDTILTAKALYCQKNWIELTAVVDGKALSFMDDMDVSSLFGNMIDNAIEGVMRVEDKKRRIIHLAVSRRQGFLCIRMENEYVPDLTFVDGIPQTIKKSKADHGYGIKSMQSTVQKYGGSLRISTEGTRFCVGILLPLPG